MNGLIDRALRVSAQVSGGKEDAFNAVLAHLVDNEETERLTPLERSALEAALTFFVADFQFTESGARDERIAQSRADARKIHHETMTALAQARGLM